jgi:hypothetical protein
MTSRPKPATARSPWFDRRAYPDDLNPGRGAPKGRDGAVEAIRALMVAKRSARAERTQAINQAKA